MFTISGDVLSLYVPHCQSGVSISRGIEVWFISLVFYLGSFFPYTSLIVKAVSASPEGLQSGFLSLFSISGDEFSLYVPHYESGVGIFLLALARVGGGGPL